MVAAVVERDGRYLITKRRANAVLPGLWEFPGGKVEAGEDDASALAREFRERLGAGIRVGELMSHVRHEYAACAVELFLYACEIEEGEIACRAVADMRWVASNEFDDYEFTPADEQSVAKLIGE